jgi:hypothetical protein
MNCPEEASEVPEVQKILSASVQNFMPQIETAEQTLESFKQQRQNRSDSV